MSYKYETQYNSPNYSKGRPQGKPNAIYIHHWGNDGQSHQGVVDYLCRKNGDSSAHYVASAGRVTCIVDPDDRAWHAGNQGNPRGIGIECRPEMSAGDFETVAELIAEIRKVYGHLPLKGHRDVMNTACPGRWYPRLAELSARADKIQGTTPAPAPARRDITALQRAVRATPDNISGPDTRKRVDAVRKASRWGGVKFPYGTAYAQGVVGTAADSVWGDKSRSAHDATVLAIQRAVGATPDGIWGSETETKVSATLAAAAQS